MAVAVYALDGVVQNAADSATGWSAGGVDTDSKIEGTGCIGAKTGSGITRYNHLGTARNFDAGELGDHVIAWFNFLTFANLDTLANGGVRAYSGNDAGTNFREFYITGLGAGYFGGWVAAIFDPTATADNSGGTPDQTAFDAFGITYNATAGIMGNFNNGLVDQITIGRGIQLTAGDGASSPGTMQGFLDADEGSAIWGFVSRLNNQVLSQMKFLIGDGTTTTEFDDTDETVIFLDRPVSTDFYEILVETDATCTFGALSAGVTSGGLTFDSAGASKYAITVVEGGTVEAVLNAYATTFKNYRIGIFNPSTTMQDCVLQSGDGQITLNGATLTDCTVKDSLVGADTGALLVDNVTEWQGGGSPIVTGCTFSGHSANANSGAIEISVTGTYTFSNLFFNGNSFDVINSSGGLVTINVTGGDTPTVRNLTTSTTVVNDTRILTIDGISDQDSRVTVVDVTVPATPVELVDEAAGVDGEVTYAYDAGDAGTAIEIYVVSDIMKIEELTGRTLSTVNETVTISQDSDGVYSNPV